MSHVDPMVFHGFHWNLHSETECTVWYSGTSIRKAKSIRLPCPLMGDLHDYAFVRHGTSCHAYCGIIIIKKIKK